MRHPPPSCKRCTRELLECIAKQDPGAVTSILASTENLNLTDTNVYDHASMATLLDGIVGLKDGTFPLRAVTFAPPSPMLSRALDKLAVIVVHLNDATKFPSIREVNFIGIQITGYLAKTLRRFIGDNQGQHLQTLMLTSTQPLDPKAEAIGPWIVQIMCAGHLPNLAVLHLEGSGLP